MAYITEEKIQELDYGKKKSFRWVNQFDREMRFTQVYEQTAGEHPYLREAICLKAQAREILMPLQDGDWFAGRTDRMFVGIDPERGDVCEAAYFCQFSLLQEQLNNPSLTEKARDDIHYLLDFWKKEATFFKCYEAFPEYVKKGLPSVDYYGTKEISYAFFGFGGPCLDYDKLCRVGLPGLKNEVHNRLVQAQKLNDGDVFFLQGALMALDVVEESALAYAREAGEKATCCKDSEIKKRYLLIASSLKNIVQRAPASFHEAIQLVWLYNLIALPRNYGRMDVYLGDFLAHDLQKGILSYDEAGNMLAGLWKKIKERGDNFNNRIIIGGRGRRNEAHADLFATLALEVQEMTCDTIPQLSLRYYTGMNEQLWDKAIDVLSKGSTFPILYNDDVNVPAAERNFRVSEKEAEQYCMYGCGEYLLDHMSTGSPDAAMNVLKALDVTLHNGIDSFSGERRGLALGSLEDFSTFEDLQQALVKQLDYQMELCAVAQATIYRVTGQYAAFPLLSVLYDDCIRRGLPLLAGGVRYLGGTVETFGNNSTADALLSIKKLVYDTKVFSPRQLLNILDHNFEGYEKERQLMLNQPKYGNDIPEADEMSVWLNSTLCRLAHKHEQTAGLDHFSVVMINNGDSVLHGKRTAASADGRKKGEPLSNGNQPGAGNDKNGITALLNSMAKLDPSLHAGVVHNLKISRYAITRQKEKIKALLKGYFRKGGTQLMITVVDKNELEEAMKNPRQYTHLIVRVGGYSERFVDLPRDIQLELIRRTLY